ncbi:MAG: shikimate kinase [Chthoniobacterales bacterium]
MTGTERSIILIGFMGTGKSAVGQQLAQFTARACLDTDEMVAQACGMPISQIFERLGEERFRDEESAVLHELDADLPSVIVTGGGVVLRPANVARLRELGSVVCLRADLPTLVRRLETGSGRPLLAAENLADTVGRLLLERQPFYDDAADFTVDTSALGPQKVALAIQDALAR